MSAVADDWTVATPETSSTAVALWVATLEISATDETMRSASRAWLSASWKIYSARVAASDTAPRICSKDSAIVFTSSRPSLITWLDWRISSATPWVSD